MLTPAFVTFMLQRLNANITREQLLDKINIAQNEILSHENRFTRIVPDPFLHTGSDDFTAASGNNAGDFDLVITQTIPQGTPTKGILLITESSITDRVQYTSFTGSTFTLSDDVSLPRSYTTAATVIVDKFEIIISGSIFSSIQGQTTRQFDIRNISRVYAFQDRRSGFRLFGDIFFKGSIRASFRPERMVNRNLQEIEISTDVTQSLEPLSEDAVLINWRENDPDTTTDVFIAETYRWPDQLTTEDVNLTIPDRFQTTLLKYGVLRDSEYTEYGRNDNPEALYEKYLAEFLTFSRQSANTLHTVTLPRF